MTIKFYKTNDPYGFLNNFYTSRMFVYGRWWNNVEAPYQAQKTDVPSEYEAIYKSATPRKARDLGQICKMRKDWDQVKDQVMYECVMAKFLQNKELRQELLATGDEKLVEDSPVDSYWGCGKDGRGQNKLGQILMRVRKELQGE